MLPREESKHFESSPQDFVMSLQGAAPSLMRESMMSSEHFEVSVHLTTLSSGTEVNVEVGVGVKSRVERLEIELDNELDAEMDALAGATRMELVFDGIAVVELVPLRVEDSDVVNMKVFVTVAEIEVELVILGELEMVLLRDIEAVAVFDSELVAVGDKEMVGVFVTDRETLIEAVSVADLLGDVDGDLVSEIELVAVLEGEREIELVGVTEADLVAERDAVGVRDTDIV